MTYGFWKLGKGIRQQKYVLPNIRIRQRERGFCFWINADVKGISELAREKMWSRIHLIPMLTAEEDRDLVRRHLADQAREKALLGSQTSPYNSDKYVGALSLWSLVWMGWQGGSCSRVVLQMLMFGIQIRTTNIRHHTKPSIKVGNFTNVGRGSSRGYYIVHKAKGYQAATRKSTKTLPIQSPFCSYLGLFNPRNISSIYSHFSFLYHLHNPLVIPNINSQLLPSFYNVPINIPHFRFSPRPEIL